MYVFLIYILKAGVVLSIFYFVYQFLLKNENIYNTNRWFLLSGLFLTFIIPFITYTKVIWKSNSHTFSKVINQIPINTNSTLTINNSNSIFVTDFNWVSVLFYLYAFITISLLLKFIIQLTSIWRFIKKNKTKKHGSFTIIKSCENIAPFSFFKTIVINTNLYIKDEVDIILTHEKIHAQQFHSIDFLCSHLLITLLWFNPLSWLYKKNIEQNLEFIADSETLKQNICLKNYQNTLFKTLNPQYNINYLTTNFNQSSIKKRIIMLNKKTISKKSWKLLFIVPLIVGFILSCNTETITKTRDVVQNKSQFKQSDSIYLASNNTFSFVPPIKIGKNISKTSGFGMRTHPILKTFKMHNGVDFKAPIGTPVFSAANGEVIFANKESGYGNIIKIKHSQGHETRYAQLNKIHVAVGDIVKTNDHIGDVGNSGASTGPHLHFEILKNDKNINPEPLIPFTINTPHSIFNLNKNTSIKQIKEIEIYFNNHFKTTKIKIENIKRNQNNEIYAFDFLAKIGNETSFTKEFSAKNKFVIKDFKIIPKDENVFWIYFNNVFTKHTEGKIETKLNEL